MREKHVRCYNTISMRKRKNSRKTKKNGSKYLKRSMKQCTENKINQRFLVIQTQRLTSNKLKYY